MLRGRGLHLERALVQLRVASRKEGARWIREGRVLVNGAPLCDPRALVEATDRIEVFGVEAAPVARLYAALHKPPGVVTTRVDPRGRPTVYDHLPADLRARWLFPIGRLDADSEGLLLFTNDGAWADRLTDPRHHVGKTYVVELDRAPPAAALERLRSGLLLDDGPTRPAAVTARADGAFEVVLREGRNRQLRRMFAAVGARVIRLVRTRVGAVTLGDLAPGAARALTAAEVRGIAGGGF